MRMCAQGATVRWAILYYFILIPTLRNNIVKAFVPSGARSAYNHKYRGLPINSQLPPLGGCVKLGDFVTHSLFLHPVAITHQQHKKKRRIWGIGDQYWKVMRNTGNCSVSLICSFEYLRWTMIHAFFRFVIIQSCRVIQIVWRNSWITSQNLNYVT